MLMVHKHLLVTFCDAFEIMDIITETNNFASQNIKPLICVIKTPCHHLAKLVESYSLLFVFVDFLLHSFSSISSSKNAQTGPVNTFLFFL